MNPVPSFSNPVVIKAGIQAPERARRVLVQPGAAAAGEGQVDRAPETVAPSGQWLSDAALAALIERARLDGRREARHEAEAAAKQAAEEVLARRVAQIQREQSDKWKGLAKALADQMATLRVGLEAQTSEWTFAAVRRFVGDACSAPALVVAAVRQVLAQANLAGGLTVRLHPKEFELVQRAGLLEAASWPADVAFAPDADLEFGGCLIEAAHERLDARLEVQLELLREQLDQLRHGRLEAA